LTTVEETRLLTSVARPTSNASEDWWQKWNPQWLAMSRACSEAIVRAAEARPGGRAIDVASGTGEPALTLASAVGRDGLVVATDLDPKLLATAKQNAQQQGVTNMVFALARAEALPFPDGSFDLVTCRFALWSFADVKRALAEADRALKKGGRATFMAFGRWERCAWFTATIGVLRSFVDLPHRPGESALFRYSQPGTLAATLQEAGFRSVREEFCTLAWTWPGPAEDLFEAMKEFPTFRTLFERVPSLRREQTDNEVLAALRQYEEGGQVPLPMDVVVASGLR
jgi:ubiquinone/menaquinone biosynthesis C-methylase UbiE